MKPLDIIILVLVALAAFRGFRRGLVGIAAGIASFVVALLIARATYQQVAHYLNMHFHFAHAVQGFLIHATPAGAFLSPSVSQHVMQYIQSIPGAISFLFVLLVAEVVLGIFARLVGRIPNAIPVVSTLNRVLGFAFSGLETLAVIAALLLLIEPLAKAGTLGPLSHYVTEAPLSTALWQLAKHFAPLLKGIQA